PVSLLPLGFRPSLLAWNPWPAAPAGSTSPYRVGYRGGPGSSDGLRPQFQHAAAGPSFSAPQAGHTAASQQAASPPTSGTAAGRVRRSRGSGGGRSAIAGSGGPGTPRRAGWVRGGAFQQVPLQHHGVVDRAVPGAEEQRDHGMLGEHL